MLSLLLVLALSAAAAVAVRPRSTTAAIIALAAGACALPLAGARLNIAETAIGTTAALAAFLVSALWLAAFAAGTGLADRVADGLAAVAGGRGVTLYGLVCVTCAVLTCTLSLDGAVILVAPMLRRLARRYGAPSQVLAVGAIATANAASLAVPQGNPTNLLVMGHLGLSGGIFARTMALPALAATFAASGAVALARRRSLADRYPVCLGARCKLSRNEWVSLSGLIAAAAGAGLPSASSLPVWSGMCIAASATALAAFALGAPVPRPAVPLRLLAQVLGLLLGLQAVAQAVGPGLPWPRTGSLAGLVGSAALAACVACTLNNLPASAALVGLGLGHSSGLAALVGLGPGAFATSHGSLATLVGFDALAPDVQALRPAEHVRLCAPAAALALITATAVLWLQPS